MKKLFVILTFTFGVTAGCAIDLPTVTQAADADGGGNCSGCRVEEFHQVERRLGSVTSQIGQRKGLGRLGDLP